MSNENKTHGEPGKKGRGKGKKPALVHVNLRIPPDVMDFYKQSPSYTAFMRQVLIDYAQSKTTT
jgi:uncharacterized protein (DUF4415 family)